MRASLFAAVLLAHLTAACTTTEPVVKIETREVLVPVARSCVPASLPTAPTYSVTREMIAAAQDPAQRLVLLGAYGLERAARLLEIEPVVTACRD